MIIEDNPGDIRLIEEMLKEHTDEKYTFFSYTRLIDVLQNPDNQNADIVLLDLNLPDSAGIQTFERFHESLPKLPVILLTGLQDETVVEKALRHGAQDYLVKGRFSANLLSRAIRYAIERKRAELALRNSEERYALATKGANDGLWDWDLKKGRIFYSDRWKSILGFETNEIENEPDQWFDRVHPDDREELKVKIQTHLNGGSNHFEHEYRMEHKDGGYRWMHTRGLAVCRGTGEAYRMAGSQTDITGKKEIENQLIQHALYDALTGLANKALLTDRLTNSISKSIKKKDFVFAFLLMDCDEFKLINSSYSHKIGDELLKAISERLKHIFRPNDTFARYGSDEFAVLLEGINDASNVLPVVERIREALVSSFSLSADRMYASLSIGIVIDDGSYREPNEVIRDADIALYRAKSVGRAGYEFFSIAMRDKIKRKKDFESKIRCAIQNEELRVYYQPIVSMGDFSAIGFEALIRWDDPVDGILPPGDFLPAAEESGSIVLIDRWLIDEVCRQLREWQTRSIVHIIVCVNLSTKHFHDRSDIVGSVTSALKTNQLSSEKLRVEITESALMENFETAYSILTQFRSMGVKIELDDFGTGFSSLSYLHRFPVDGLKIDRSFVGSLTSDSGSEKIVRTIISLAHDLDLDVIAEGVETIEQEEMLTGLSCEYAQGYHYAKPLAAKKAEKLIGELSLPRKVL